MKMMFKAYGNSNITALHDKSIEFTTDSEIGKKADCVLGVNAQFNIADLEFLRQKVKVEIIIKVKDSAGEVEDKIIAYGSPDLVFKTPNGLIIRRSNQINEKTICVYADKAAKDLSRELVERLKNPEQEIIIEINKIGEYEKLDFYEGLRFINE